MINPWWAVPSNPMASTSICLLHCPPYIYLIKFSPSPLLPTPHLPISPSPHTSPIPYSLFPVPCSRFPTPCSLFPTPYSLR
ncbi:MAG: hypothetical protein F6K50_38575 [Moorea sp. SIO3I7]|uniref:hypothetical protein n=1 Tax=Moorena sp. SIO3I8 TaxID=2607833 RepID=UPI0013C98591|nr:hypothetical protein [Moorena sp. SIO3I8]NEO01115.1 hypothetical protein [Moorena sp. SIO3I7]